MVDNNPCTGDKKWSSPMPASATRSDIATRSTAKAKLDVTAFAGNVRRFSKEVRRVGKAPLPGVAEAKFLGRTFDQLEKNIRALRGRFGAILGSGIRGSTKTVAANHAIGLKFDTTEAMVEKGQLIDPVKFQELMGWKSRQAVWKAAHSNRVFFIEHRAQRYFPTFYANPAYQRSHLEAVTKILGDLPGGSKLQFFLTRKGSLGGKTSLEALATGDLAKVKRVAEAFAEVPMKA
jgi:hypothetical protein